jgi:hypothetical protein
MEQVTTAPKEQEGGTAERNPPETLEEHHKIAILPGILPPKIGSESSGSSSASAPPHVPQAAMASVHSQVPIPASGFDPVQAVPRSGSPEFVPIAATGGPAAAMPQGILPPPAGESSVATSYAGHDPYQYQSVRHMYDSSANQAQHQWQQFTMGHPMPNAYPLYTPPSYEIGTDYAAASYPAHVASGGYHYGANVQPQTAYPQLYDPSYQLRQNQRLTAAGYGQYARSQRQDRGQVGDYAQFDREGGDRGRRKRSEDPESARDPGPPIGNHLRGPDGANLFVFHIPNTMTNQDLYRLFSQYGNVLSATIKTEAKTGRGRGFGFVNYDTTDAASRAIHHLNGAAVSSPNHERNHFHTASEFVLLTLSFSFRLMENT